MKPASTLISSVALAIAGATLVTGAHAQAQALAGTPIATQQAGDMADAEVRRVDKANQKITLKHGPIKNLDMPPMTMVFNVNDAAMLDKVQPGDKVRFSATGEGGRYTVTDLQPAK